MKQEMIDYMQKPKNDNLYPPEEAVSPLLKYLPAKELTEISRRKPPDFSRRG